MFVFKFAQKSGTFRTGVLFRCNKYSSTTADIKNDPSPLTGIRVLDLSRVLAGPFCAMVLGDLGAEIIKVELPVKGDDTRHYGPPFIQDESCYFFGINRNKKSITIDMKKKEGQELIKQLAMKSDILLENFLPGKIEELGLGYEQLKPLAPKLIYCSITGDIIIGFGSSGPYRNKPGYDVIAAAYGGLLHTTGPSDGHPCKVGVAMTDITTGLYAHGAILAALLRRQQVGFGQRIECNLLSTQMAIMSNIASNYLNAGMEARRWGTQSESIVPYQAFKTLNGFVVIGAANDNQFVDMCKRIETDELITDPRFKSNQLRVENRNVLIDILSARFEKKSNEEWLQIFKGSRCAVGPVNNIAQAFNDPQVIHNKLVVELPHSTIANVKVVGPPVTYEDGGNFCRLPPPTLGQHTKHVLENILGMTNSQIEDLKRKKIV